MIYGTRMSQPSQQSLRTDKSGLNYGYGQVQTERRTPDTYGRSAVKPRSGRGNGDYEEVYGVPQLYQRPAGPVGYSKGASPAPIPIPLYAQQYQQHQQQIHSPVASVNGRYTNSDTVLLTRIQTLERSNGIWNTRVA